MILQYINFNYSTIFTHSQLIKNILDMLHCEISTDKKKNTYSKYITVWILLFKQRKKVMQHFTA